LPGRTTKRWQGCGPAPGVPSPTLARAPSPEGNEWRTTTLPGKGNRWAKTGERVPDPTDDDFAPATDYGRLVESYDDALRTFDRMVIVYDLAEAPYRGTGPLPTARRARLARLVLDEGDE
jgi:hypothetical protein